MMARGFNVVALVSVLCAMTIITFQITFISFSYHSFRNDTKRTNAIHYTSINIFVCLAISFSFWIIQEFTYRLSQNARAYLVWYWLCVIFLSFSFLSFYGLMVLRLHHIFRGTAYQISQKIIFWHLIINALSLMLSYVSIYFFLYHLEASVHFIFFGVMLAVFCCGLLHLIWLFNSKLFQLTLTMNDAHCSLNERQLAMLKTLRKHTLLGSLLVFAVLGDICIVIVFVLSNNAIVWWIGWCISFSSGSLCVFLGFTANQTRYDRICWFCDNGCDVLCQYIVQKNMKKNEQKYELMTDEL